MKIRKEAAIYAIGCVICSWIIGIISRINISVIIFRSILFFMIGYGVAWAGLQLFSKIFKNVDSTLNNQQVLNQATNAYKSNSTPRSSTTDEHYREGNSVRHQSTNPEIDPLTLGGRKVEIPAFDLDYIENISDDDENTSERGGEDTSVEGGENTESTPDTSSNNLSGHTSVQEHTITKPIEPASIEENTQLSSRNTQHNLTQPAISQQNPVFGEESFTPVDIVPTQKVKIMGNTMSDTITKSNTQKTQQEKNNLTKKKEEKTPDTQVFIAEKVERVKDVLGTSPEKVKTAVAQLAKSGNNSN